MKIDLLRPLAPSEYKFRQDVLDMMFAISKSNPKPTCHQDEIAKATKAKKEKIETVILYLVRYGYAKHVGQYHEPLYALNAKGQTASIDREFLRTGRDETYRTLSVYGGYIAIVTSIGMLLASLITIPQVRDLERRIESMEQGIEQPELRTTTPKTHRATDHQDSSITSSDSAMLGTAANEKPDP